MGVRLSDFYKILESKKYYFLYSDGQRSIGNFTQQELAMFILNREVEPIATRFPQPFEDLTKPRTGSCSHPNKKHVKMQTFEYDYCPDCKKEI